MTATVPRKPEELQQVLHYQFKNPALLRIALPVCIATVVTNLTSVIDLTTVLTRLDTAIRAVAELAAEL